MLLEIENLSVTFPSHQGVVRAVDGVSLSVREGEVLGLVGESGSGKSVTMMALMGLVAYPGQVLADKLRFAGHDLLVLSQSERQQMVGKDIAMIFQDPTTSLNPCFTVGFQLAETLRLHMGLDHKAAKKRSVLLLEQVGISAPESRLKAYPHQLSGGMNQRVMIAMAIACKPRLLIADEPTTALDVTTQAQILDLLRSLQQEHGMALVLISHNMGVVSEMAQRVAVMYAGQIMEESGTQALFNAPQHPYTQALLAALPERSDGKARLATIPGMVPGLYDMPTGCLFAPRCAYVAAHCHSTKPLLCVQGGAPEGGGGKVRCHEPLVAQQRQGVDAHCQVSDSSTVINTEITTHQADQISQTPQTKYVVEASDLERSYEISRGFFSKPALLQAVGGISFSIAVGKTLAVVGESGCGKSTLARMVSLIEKPSAGVLRIHGVDAVGAGKKEQHQLRKAVQLVFQNPYGSLNPRKKVGAILEAPLKINTALLAAECADKAKAMLALVGLRPEHYDRYPHMFSGGQRQRIVMARALMLNPALVVADEPVSALDVSIQAQVLNLMVDLQQTLGLAYLLISHDLGVVRHIAHDVLVMYRGHAVEQGEKSTIFSTPLHPYTKALLASTPGLAGSGGVRQRMMFQADLLSPLNPPAGCVFSMCCPQVTNRCQQERPVLRMVAKQLVACHHAG